MIEIKMLILNTCSFQEKILSNLLCALEDDLKHSCVLKIMHGGVYCYRSHSI